MKIKALLFDLDGLIFDSEKVYYRCWKQAGEDCGFSIPHETLLALRSCDSTVARERLEGSLGEKGGYDQIRARRKEIMKPYLVSHDPEMKDGVTGFLEKVRAYPHVRKAVVTQSRMEDKEAMLRKAGLWQYFDEIVCAEDVRRGKPFPDIYEYACRKLSLKPEECIAFEDSPNGIVSAHGAGVNTVMIPDMSQPDEELSGICFGVFPTLEESFSAIEPLLEEDGRPI